jgi:prolipoprotein diacylglyceryltransferase
VVPYRDILAGLPILSAVVGRPSDASRAMIFQPVDDAAAPPSQLYEAAGLAGCCCWLFWRCWLFSRRSEKPGLAMGLFGVCYGIARYSPSFSAPEAKAKTWQNGLTMAWFYHSRLLSSGGLL